MDPEITRRTLLGGLAAGSAGMAGGVLGPAEASTRGGDLPARVDVAVVGAGLSGLVAARDVARTGASVVVLESRDRVGGRVLNQQVGQGSVLEAGGAFVGPTQHHIRRLARELGVPEFKEYAKGENVYVSRTTGRQTYTGTVPPDPLVLPDAAQLIYRIDRMSRQVPVDAPWTAPKAEEWDAVTLLDWLRSNSVNPQVITLLLSYLQPTFGADALELSLLFVLWYVACSGDADHPGSFERSAGTSGGAQDSRFVGGSGLIPRRLARDLGDAVALDAAVTRVDQRDHGVRVHSARGVVQARRVVVAAPPPTVHAIDFTPQLPVRRAQLLQRLHMGNLMKCDAVYEAPFWRADGLSGMGVADSGAVRVCFDNSPPDTDVGVLLAFVGGSTWRRFGTQDSSARRRAVLDGFAAFFGERARHPVDFVEHDWNRERWTQGGPVAIAGPGTTTAYGPSIRVPVGRLHWAGTETATYWSGYMDGAVSAGERAAAEVVHALRA